MKRKSVRKAPRRRAAPRWIPYGGLVFGPIPSPHGSSAGVFVARGPSRRYAVMALSTPNGFLGMGTAGVLDDHAHAVIAEDVRSLAEAKRLGEAWAKKFRKGLVLAPCACEDMVEAGEPSATRPEVKRLLPAASPSASREDCTVCKAIPGRCVQHDVIDVRRHERLRLAASARQQALASSPPGVGEVDR